MDKKKILIVDDTPENLALLYKTLRDEYEVIGANNGHEALRLASENGIHLILLDVMMPEISGFEVCRQLKDNESTRDIPVIFLTALTDETDESTGFALGAVDYITKPFKPLILKHRIATHLDLKSKRDLLALKNSLLEEALARVKELSGLLPICMKCKKIRDDNGYWNQLESYISQHSEALFSHCYCPDCATEQLREIEAMFQHETLQAPLNPRHST